MGSRTASVAAAVAVAAALTGCSSSDSLTADPQPAAVTVGSNASPDGEVLAEIYASVLRGTGSPVTTRLGLGEDEMFAELDAGDLTLVPAYTGELLLRFQPGSTVTETEEVFDELNRSLPQGLSVSDAGTAEDPDAVGEVGDRAAANVVPLMRTGVLTDRQVESLNVVAGELTSDELAEMADAVRSGETSPGQAAADWLAAR